MRGLAAQPFRPQPSPWKPAPTAAVRAVGRSRPRTEDRCRVKNGGSRGGAASCHAHNLGATVRSCSCTILLQCRGTERASLLPCATVMKVVTGVGAGFYSQSRWALVRRWRLLHPAPTAVTVARMRWSKLSAHRNGTAAVPAGVRELGLGLGLTAQPPCLHPPRITAATRSHSRSYTSFATLSAPGHAAPPRSRGTMEQRHQALLGRYKRGRWQVVGEDKVLVVS
ncbi:hypothetical protein B0H14DRAFT_1320648 [Mycena olivaceomarginata]|nr:hypothetical protein B0H14DRAFT_1320648 [Mycena olivaceomarginata]